MLLSVHFAAVQTVCFCWRLHEQESHKKMIVNVTGGLQAFPLLIYIFHAVSVFHFCPCLSRLLRLLEYH